MSCIFCQSTVENIDTSPNDGGIYGYDCPKCGRYFITSDLYYDLNNVESLKYDRQKAAHLLAERSILKYGAILLSNSKLGIEHSYNEIILNDFLDFYPKDAGELMNRAFLCLARKLQHPADQFVKPLDSVSLLFARNVRDQKYMIRQFVSAGFIRAQSEAGTHYTIEAIGWQYINTLKTAPSGYSNQVFVAMWFDENRRVFYEQGIKPAIEEVTNYKSIRVDSVQHNNKICDQIIAEIRKSKFMVADFTGDRSGVYYEAGFAQGLGIPVIWVVDETDVKNLHFDTRQYNHITYKDAEDLRVKLRARIEATIV